MEANLNTLLPMTTAEEKREYDVAYSASYREKNKEEVSRKKAKCRANNREQKKFFCEVCGFSFECRRDLERHNETLKHQYAILNALD